MPPGVPPYGVPGFGAVPFFGGAGFGFQGFQNAAPPPSSSKKKPDPLENYYERWLDLTMEPFAVQVEVAPGGIIEVATTDANGTVDGTALYMVRQKYPLDAWGCFFELAFAGASSPSQSVVLQQGFHRSYPLGGGPYLLHWCAGPSAQCQGVCHRQALHSTYLRFRKLESIKEPWALDIKALRTEILGPAEEEVSSDKPDNVRKLRERYLALKLDDPKLSPSERMNIAIALDKKGSKERGRRSDGESSRDKKRRRKHGKKKKEEKGEQLFVVIEFVEFECVAVSQGLFSERWQSKPCSEDRGRSP